MPAEEAEKYRAPFEYVEANVLPYRQRSKSVDRIGLPWWQHRRTRPAMQAAVRELSRYIAASAVSKHRTFIWVPATTLADHAVVVVAREDDYFFGVLHSHLHELWALRLGTSLEDRPRYTPSTTFDTFPFPWPPGKEPSEEADPRVKEIAEAARELVRLRDEWLAGGGGVPNLPLEKRTLTGLYNQRPDWLDLAHGRLDTAVFAAYEWPSDLSDDEILERLLALNLQRAAAQGAAPDVDVAD